MSNGERIECFVVATGSRKQRKFVDGNGDKIEYLADRSAARNGSAYLFANKEAAKNYAEWMIGEEYHVLRCSIIVWETPV